ncbi:homeobox protein HoxA/B/C/D4 [Sarotherodon galilaeus]
MSSVEELREEVVREMHTLSKDQLVSMFLGIADKIDVSRKTRLSLLTHIQIHIEREDITVLEDEGMSELLLLNDKIGEVMKETNVETEPNANEGDNSEHREQPNTATLLVTETANVVNTVVTPHSQAHRLVLNSSVLSVPQRPSLYWQKDFKISGQIGKPGQKDKLRFSSLAHQIENGLSRGYSELDIVDAVIRAILPGLQLRSYLEGKAQLTLPTLRRILRSHFQEKSATELYKQLASEVQTPKETAQSFLIRVLDLKQKVLFASQESESGLKYDPALVQRMCLHTILAGFQSDSVRIDMQPLLLDSKTPDELLLESLNMACGNEAEMKNKKRSLASQTATSVSAVQSDDVSPAKNPMKEVRAKIPREILTELAELKTGVASLKGQPVPGPQSYVPPPVMQYDRDHQQQYYSFQGPFQRPPPPQYPVQHYTGSPARRERRCHICQQNGVNEHCTHCYLCGNREHFQAGCRSRGMRPSKEKHLNQQWLPPRDEC